MDVYAQAMTPAKRKAQGKVVAMLRDQRKEAGLKVVCPRCVPGEKWGFQQVFYFVGVPDGI